MHDLIPPQERATLKQELARAQPIAFSHGLALYDLEGERFPATLREIGRLREQVFRSAGAGRGVDCDLDELDQGPLAYRQLIAWDPHNLELVALYRYQLGERATEAGDGVLRTARLFDYSPAFRKHYLPWSIELGRSVVNPHARRRRLGFHAIWRGLGALTALHPNICYFFGNVSLYQSIPKAARDTMIQFLERHYAPTMPLLIARPGLRYEACIQKTAPPVASADSPKQRIQRLRQAIQSEGVGLPPILQAYLSLGLELWFGDTVHDADFGDALEIGIVVPLDRIDPSFRERFMS